MSDLSDAIEAVEESTELVASIHEKFQRYLNETLTWQTGTEDGGPNANGYYPFTAPDDTVVLVPSPALLAKIARPAKGTTILSIAEFYATDTTTDTQALQAAATLFALNASAPNGGNFVLTFRPNGGRSGPNGQYVIDSLVTFTGTTRLELDGNGATLRIATADGGIRYREDYNRLNSPQVNLNGFYPHDFVVEAFVANVAFAFHWDFRYRNSRTCSTGTAQRVRARPQDVNSAYNFVDIFRCTNVWMWSGQEIDGTNKPAIFGNIIEGTSLLNLQGKCVEVNLDYCHASYFDKPIRIGWIDLRLVNLAFVSNPSAAILALGYSVQQGSAVGYIGRKELTTPGMNYALFDIVGTFTTGSAILCDYSGAQIATLNITVGAVKSESCEAIFMGDDTAFALNNYGIHAPITDNVGEIRALQITVGSSAHINAYISAIYARNVNDITVETLLIPGAANCVVLDIAKASAVRVKGASCPNNDLTFNNVTFLKLRDTVNFSMIGCNIHQVDKPWDLDLTVKDGVVALNTGYQCGQPITDCNRYNSVSTRGVRFFGNGLIGKGLDLDDNVIRTATTAIAPASGSITSGSATWRYLYSGGAFTFTCSVTVTNRGTASGTLKVAFPNDIKDPAGTSIYDSICAAHCVSTGEPLSGYLSAIAGPGNTPGVNVYREGAGDVFRDKNNNPGNFSYIFTGSVPLRID